MRQTPLPSKAEKKPEKSQKKAQRKHEKKHRWASARRQSLTASRPAPGQVERDRPRWWGRSGPRLVESAGRSWEGAKPGARIAPHTCCVCRRARHTQQASAACGLAARSSGAIRWGAIPTRRGRSWASIRPSGCGHRRAAPTVGEAIRAAARSSALAGGAICVGGPIREGRSWVCARAIRAAGGAILGYGEARSDGQRCADRR